MNIAESKDNRDGFFWNHPRKFEVGFSAFSSCQKNVDCHNGMLIIEVLSARTEIETNAKVFAETKRILDLRFNGLSTKFVTSIKEVAVWPARKDVE